MGAAGGIAHPPGYPLFVLWCRLWSWLPDGSPTHEVALATAIAGAFAVDAVRRAARAWGASDLGADFAATMFAIGPLAWRLASEPEVFALNVALVLTIVRLAAPAPWKNEGHRAVVLALTAGLALSNHHTALLVAPIGLFALVRALRAAPNRVVAGCASAAAFATGLLPYGYLLLTKSPCRWNDVSSLGQLAHHFLRVDYGTTQLATSTEPPEPLRQLGLLGWSFVDSGIAITCLIGLVVVFRRARTWSWLALVAALLLAGPIFATRFNLPPHGLSAHVVERFHLLPLALASVVGAVGIDAIVAALQSRAARLVSLGAALALVLLRATTSGATVVALHRPTTQRYLENVFAILPTNSILVARGDDLTGGFEYMQCALDRRPDIVVLSPPLMLSNDYARRMSAKVGVELERGVIPPDGTRPVLNGTQLLADLVATKRPVFLTAWYAPHLDRTFPSYPVGPLIRVVPKATDVLVPDELFALNDQLAQRMTLDASPPPAHTWAGIRYGDYARPWSVLERAFIAEHDDEKASLCRARVEALTVHAPSE